MKRTNESTVRFSFALGMIFALALTLIYQDVLGKEAYVQHISASWTNSAISLPIEIFFLLIAIVYYCRLRGTARSVDAQEMRKENAHKYTHTNRNTCVGFQSQSQGDEYGDWPGASNAID